MSVEMVHCRQLGVSLLHRYTGGSVEVQTDKGHRQQPVSSVQEYNLHLVGALDKSNGFSYQLPSLDP